MKAYTFRLNNPCEQVEKTELCIKECERWIDGHRKQRQLLGYGFCGYERTVCMQTLPHLDGVGCIHCTVKVLEM